MAWCRYRTSCEEDEAIISSTTAGPRQKVAARLLRIEKVILRGAAPPISLCLPVHIMLMALVLWEGKGEQLCAVESQHVQMVCSPWLAHTLHACKSDFAGAQGEAQVAVLQVPLRRP